MTTTRTPESYPVGLSNWAIPPGDSIAELAAQLVITPQSLAELLELAPADLGRLLCGELELTTEIASRLEKALGEPMGFWLNLETQYRQVLRNNAIVEAPKRKRA